MRKITRFTAAFFAFALSCGASFAAIWMPKIFSDNMMLQREKQVKIWGTAAPNAKVDVKFDGQSVSAKADAQGNWQLQLKPMRANKNAQSLTVLENGKAGAEIKNVLIGEVWVIGGQSNMQWTLAKTTDYPSVKDLGDIPELRRFNQDLGAMAETPQKDSPKGANWAVFNTAKDGDFSGVGFYFARALMKDIGVPVALISTPLGGTAMRTWIPESLFDKVPFLKSDLAAFKKEKAAYDYKAALEKWNKGVSAYNAAVAKAKADGKKIPERPAAIRARPSEISPRRAQSTPCYNYNAKIAPLAGFAVRGFLWYQGESDANDASRPSFEEQFSLLINSWRSAWGSKNLPFLFVQLASFTTKPDWAETRWAQYKTSKNVPLVYMANIIDCGEEKDIHPKDKTTVGSRLEKLALKYVYKMANVRADAPEFKSASFGGNAATVAFDTFGGKLEGRGDAKGFEVLVSGKWAAAASAQIQGADKVVVKAPEGAVVQGVRYLWKNWALPEVWLFNQDGLPAVSFTSLKK